MTGKFEMADMTAGELSALVKNVGGPDNARRIIRGEMEVRERDKPSLLKSIGESATVPGAAEFRVAEAFAKGKHVDGVRIYGVNADFRKHFLGKTEKKVPEVRVTAHELTEASRDPAIITALGGEERAELQLAHLRELMRRTQAGERTLLQRGTNGFHVQDEDGTLWAVNASWDACGRDWCVFAFSVGNPNPWDRGDRVLSRDS